MCVRWIIILYGSLWATSAVTKSKFFFSGNLYIQVLTSPENKCFFWGGRGVNGIGIDNNSLVLTIN